MQKVGELKAGHVTRLAGSFLREDGVRCVGKQICSWAVRTAEDLQSNQFVSWMLCFSICRMIEEIRC